MLTFVWFRRRCRCAALRRATALEQSLVDLSADLHASRADSLAAQRTAADLRGCLERSLLDLRRSDDRSAALSADLERTQALLLEARAAAAAAADADGDGNGDDAGPLSAQGIVRISGAQAFASEAFETISARAQSSRPFALSALAPASPPPFHRPSASLPSIPDAARSPPCSFPPVLALVPPLPRQGLRWERGGPGVHRFTHKATGFAFQVAAVEEAAAGEAAAAAGPDGACTRLSPTPAHPCRLRPLSAAAADCARLRCAVAEGAGCLRLNSDSSPNPLPWPILPLSSPRPLLGARLPPARHA